MLNTTEITEIPYGELRVGDVLASGYTVAEISRHRNGVVSVLARDRRGDRPATWSGQMGGGVCRPYGHHVVDTIAVRRPAQA